jgi:cytosine/adenosine deaminase-related metal-dependent hydrolase
MIRYHAAWVVPIDGRPVRDGWVTVDRDRIVATGHRTAHDDVDAVDLGEVAVMPGLVNAHTHLELSYLRDEVAPASEFVTWIRGLLAARRRQGDALSPEILAAINGAVAEAVACGTAVVGDISNTLGSFAPLARSPLAAVVFYEIVKFNAPDPGAVVERARREIAALRPSAMVRASLAAHAPYSVAPLLFRAIRQDVDRDAFAPCSVHLSESAEETEFIKTAGGPWRELLEELGSWDPAWTAPGGSPVQYLDENGFLDAHVLAVHGVQMSPDDLARLASRGTTLVTCPRSNGHTGAGVPPIEDFYKSGVRVAIGTDSLASTPDLSVFAEVATLHALAPSVPASALLDSATRQGARALGFDADFGTIEPGKRSRLLAVDLPPQTDDVEEYLVSGVQPGQIHWLE